MSSTRRTLSRFRSWLVLHHPGEDQDLVERFLAQRDEQAFQLLVERYGPLVLSVCRRQLNDSADADDAFQATFLVLARKAEAIRQRCLIGPWLCGVAYRIARRLRETRRPVAVADLNCAEPHSGDPVDRQESIALLDEELDRLGEKYRLPLVLHYLQGKSQQEVADELGCSLRTTERRLAQGRDLLRTRLERRGVALTLGLAALESAEVSAALVERTAVLPGLSPAGSSRGSYNKPEELAEETLVAMSASKLRPLLACLLLAGVAVTGLAWLSAFAGNEEMQPAVPFRGGVEQTAPPRLDVHGDPLPAGALARFGTTRLRAKATIFGVAFIDDNTLATVDNMGVQYWDVHTGRQVKEFPCEGPPLCCLSPKFLAHADGQNSLVIRDAARLTVLGRSPPLGAKITRIQVQGDTFLALDEQHGLSFWSPTGKERAPRIQIQPRTRRADELRHLVLFPELGLVAHGGEQTALGVWDIKEGKKIASHALITKTDWCLRRVFAGPDGKTIVGVTDERVVFWDVRTGKELHAIPSATLSGPHVTNIAFSPADGTLAIGQGIAQQGLLVDPRSGKITGKFGEALALHFAETTFTAFRADGKALAVSAGHAVRIWDLPSGREHLFLPGHTHGWIRPHFYGNEIVTQGLGQLQVWDRQTGKYREALPLFEGRPEGLCFAADGNWWRAHDAEVTRWHRNILQATLPNDKDNAIGILARARDGSILVGAGADADDNATITIWDARTGKKLAYWIDHECESTEVNGTLTIYLARVALLDLSADARLLATTHRNVIKLYDASTGKALESLSLSTDPQALAFGLEFTPDGRRLRAEVRGEKNSRGVIWELATGQPCWSNALSGIFTPDGRGLVAGNEKGTLQVIDLLPGVVVKKVQAHDAAIFGMCFSPDGKSLLTTSEDKTGLVWNGTSLLETKPEPLNAAELGSLWKDLAREPQQAYRAVLRLRCGGDSTVAYLAKQLTPASSPEEEVLDRLIAALDSSDFPTRQAAQVELVRYGGLARSAVERALAAQPALEARRRLEAVRATFDSLRVSDAEVLRMLRALEVLEGLDTPTARQLLKRLGDGAAHARLTREARASLARLKLRHD
ncbi:MAG: sigma-70 family RNA polymerase sigma factor [Gemmataceae bacterium]